MTTHLKSSLTFFFILLSIYSKAQVDTKFWFAAPDVIKEHGDTPALFRITALDNDAIVTISIPASGVTYDPITISANSQESVEFTHGGNNYDLDDIENTPGNSINQKGILITSTSDITVYYDVTNSSNPDRFTLKGDNALGTEFYISSQSDYENVYNSYSQDPVEQVNIVATEDGTTVKITPTEDVSGHVANVTYTVSLNRGETYCILGTSKERSYSLGGTHITSDKEIAITISDDSVHDGANTHSNGGAWDLIGDQTVPVSICGTEYVAMYSGNGASGYSHTPTSKVYITATQDNTTIQADISDVNTAYYLINAGETKSLDIEDLSSIHISASAPVYVYQLSGLLAKTNSYNELGSAILPPITCTGSTSVTFTRVLNSGFYVQVLSEYKNIGYFTFTNNTGTASNAMSFDESEWSRVPNTGAAEDDDTWYFTNQAVSISTGTAYTLTNSNGLFHLSVFDQNNSSASFGYFSAFNSLAIHGVTEACEGDAVTLTASESLGSYNWYSEATEDSVLSSIDSLVVTESGKYWVTATRMVYNETCSLADTIDVDFEIPEFILDSVVEVCSLDPYSITPEFTSGKNQDYDFEWVYGTDISTDSIFTYIPTGADTIVNVYVTVTNEDGCSVSDTIDIHILPETDIDFNIEISNNSATLCYGSTLTNTTDLYDYEWRFGSSSGTVIDTTSSITVYNQGWYFLTADNEYGCSATDSVYININTLPEIILVNDTLCFNDTYTSPSYTSSYTYAWASKYSGINSNSLSVSLTESDSLFVAYTDNTTGCINKDSAYIYFRPETEIDSVNLSLCAYTDYTFTASNKIKGNYSWYYKGNDLNISTASLILTNILLADAGTYTVSGLDENGCEVSQDFILTVNVGDNIELGDDKFICEGNSTILGISNSSYSTSWYYNQNPEENTSATVVSSDKTYSVNVAGSYYIQATSSTNGCTSIDSVKVIVNDLPNVSLSDLSAQCQGTSHTFDAGSGFTSYKWQDNSTNQTFTATKPQTVYVSVIDANGCSNSDTTNYTWKDVNVIQEDTIVVCPESTTSIDLEAGLSNISWKFYDNYGSAVSNLNGNTSASYGIVNVDTLDAGKYIISATEDGCDVTDTTELFVVATASINLGDDRTICNGETIQLNANKGFVSYAWYLNDDLTKVISTNESVTAGSVDSESSTEIWTVNAVFENGTNTCELTSTVDVEKKLLPDLTLQDIIKPCTYDTVSLSDIIVEAYSNSGDVDTLGYYWNGSNESSALGDLYITESGSYTLQVSNTNLIYEDGIVTDTLYCYVSDDTEADYRDLFTYDLSDQYICPETTVTLDAPTAVTSYSELENYQWVYLDDNGNAVDSCDTMVSWENIGAAKAGNYVLKVQYTDSLCVASDTLEVVVKESPSVTIYGDTVIFDGESTNLSTDYGFQSYLWSTSSTSESIDVSNAGFYSVSVVGQNDCTNADTTQVVVLDLPSFADISLNDSILCHDETYTSPEYGDSFEFIWTTKVSGVTSYKSSVSLTQTDSLYLTVTDPTTGYTKRDTAFIYFRPETIIDSTIYKLCAYTTSTFDASDLIVADYAWSIGGEDLNISTNSYTLTNILPTDAGTYTVTGIDQYGCVVSQDFILSVSVGSTLELGVDKEICSGDSIQLSAPVSATSYNWYYNENPEETQSGTVVSESQKLYINKEGTYYVMAIGTSNGCSSVDSIDVIVNSLPKIDLPDVSEQCQGVSYDYDAGAFSAYEWQDGSSGQTYTALQPQTVSVTVTNENGCSNADTTIYRWKEVHVIDDDTIVVCPETSYTIELEEVLSDISWSFINNYGDTTDLNNSTSSYYISNVDTLDAGMYIISADENGCEVLDTTRLFVVATASINLGDDRTICNGETIQLNANEGFVSYQWYLNNDLTKLISEERSVTAGSVDAEEEFASTEIWTVNAVYDNGTNTCSLESTVDVEKKELPEISLMDIIQPCTNDTVALANVIIESYTNSDNYGATSDTLGYFWNGASESSSLDDISITKSGTYVLEVSNTNTTTEGDILYCYSSDTLDAEYRNLFTMSTLLDKLLCPGETTTLDAPSDVISYSELENYQWVHLDDEGNVISSNVKNTSWSDVSDAGDYVLQMEYTDSLCIASDTLTIVTKEMPDVSIYGDTIICSGDTTTLSTEYGYNSYIWSTGQTTESVDVAEAGKYVLTIEGLNNCSNSDTTTLVVNRLPIITLADSIAGICNNSFLELSVDNVSYADGTAVVDPAYKWNTWDTTSSIIVSSVGDYEVSVSDENGCSGTDTVSVFSFPVTTLDLSGIDTVGCSNEGILLESPLSLNEIISYQWTKSEETDYIPALNTNWTVYESGTYVLSVIDANSCEVKDSVVIEIYTSPSLDLGDDRSECISSSYELSSSADFSTYLWSTGETTSSISISDIGENIYWLMATDSLGCSVGDTVNINTVKVPSVSIEQPDTVCAGTTVELVPEVSGTNSYSLWWNTNSSAESITVYSGTYTVTATDEESGCSGSDTVTVLNYTTLEVSLGNDQYICPLVDTLYISPEEGDIYEGYLWHNDKSTYEIVGDLGAINSVTVTDEHGCTALDQVILQYLSYSDSTFSYVMCQQDTTISLLDIDSDADNHTGEYFWYTDGSVEDYKTFSTSDTARVSVGITIDNGENTCYYKQDTIIIDFYPLPVITALDTLIYQTVTIEMDNDNPPYSYSMDSVIWQDDNSFEELSGEGEYTVYVIDNNNCSTSETFTLSDDVEIDVPKFFTPNEDGYNDTWSIEGIERLPNSIIRIYDRYGKLIKIYKATDEGWDGTYHNKPMPVADYWYVIDLKPINKLLKGHFTLKR